MAYSRRLGVLGLVSACWLVAVACSDDEDRKPGAGDAGEGGDGGGGKAGSPSIGGNMSQAGKAGMSGGGTAGDAGSGTGGTGEAGSGGIVAGAGGEGGDAGTSAPIGGAGGDGPSSGGEGGALTGAGGEGGAAPAVAKSCVAACAQPSDCTRVDAPPGECSEADTCVDPAEVCSANEDCAPEISGWTLGCTTTADCNADFGEICVDYRGQTWCAIAEDATFGCDPFVADEATLHEGGADATVCVDPLARCYEGKCTPHCETVGCAADEGDTCNPVSGVCECENSSECGNKACVNSRCTECASDADCTAGALATGHDKCVGGKCGCATADSCPAGDYPGATVTCQ